MKRAERVHKLHEILKAHRAPTSTQILMDKLKCSRATLSRLLNDLRVRGAPIENQPGKGYYYDKCIGDFELPGVWFTPEELQALLAMSQLLQRIPPGLVRERVGPIQSKLQKLLDSALRGQCTFPTNRFRILAAQARRFSSQNFAVMAAAVVERSRCSFDYLGRTKNIRSHRVVSPQRLAYYRDQWYADCWDEEKQALRIFALDRMDAVVSLGETAHDVSETELDTTLTTYHKLRNFRRCPAAHCAYSILRRASPLGGR